MESSSQSFDAQRLEDLLTEIGTQIVQRGLDAESASAEWANRAVSFQVDPEGIGAMVEAGACRVGLCGPDPVRIGELSTYIDHTLLKPDATLEQIDKLCAEALDHNFASVCVNGTWVRRCSEILSGSEVLVCAVVGFPLGATVPESKAFEASQLVQDGACEIDMVINVGALKSGDDGFVQEDIRVVAEACHQHSARLKVILETCLLTDEEKVRGCRLAMQAGADFVKTSTGFSNGGATAQDVALMRRAVGPELGVKASGGVRDQSDAYEMIDAGATRIGASASVAIVAG